MRSTTKRRPKSSVSSRMMRGKVVWFDEKKGYGFIKPDDGSADVFVHYSAIQSKQNRRNLNAGQYVEFEQIEDEKRRGPVAIGVKVIEP